MVISMYSINVYYTIFRYGDACTFIRAIVFQQLSGYQVCQSTACKTSIYSALDLESLNPRVLGSQPANQIDHDLCDHWLRCIHDPYN